MRPVRQFLLLSSVTITLTLLAISSVKVRSDAPPPPDWKQQAEQPLTPRQRFELPKIFDFEMYKRLFKRVYSGLEETVRRKYVLARAFRVWISSLKYKYQTISFYLALNQFSDRSPEEMERMSNHHLGPSTSETKHAEVAQTITIPEVGPDDIEEKLSKLTGGNVDDMKELNSTATTTTTTSRRKRDASGCGQLRDLDLDKLISLPQQQESLDPETAAKVVRKPPGNNLDYEAPEMISQGVRDDHKRTLKWYEPDPDDQEPPEDLRLVSKGSPDKPETAHWSSFLLNSVRSLIWADGESSAPNQDNQLVHQAIQQLPDELFLDHRQSKCMFPPRSQGDCGSCYAFAMITIAEWLYCNQTGKLVAFSEQYLVDCGKATRMVGGCDGGNYEDSGDFIHNYGLELRSSYPYWGREDQCPYDENTNPKTMGYIRMDLKSGFEVPVDQLELYLPFGPMFVGLSTKNGFHEYGGGVLDGAGCLPEGTHAVVLVGHGREHGREYWLIRNSHGAGWGEKGYVKLAKDSDCIQPRSGALFGTEDGESMVFKARPNKQNDPKVVSNHQAKIAAQSRAKTNLYRV